MIPFDPRETMAAVMEEVTDFQHDVSSKVLGTVVLSTPVGLPTSWQSPPPKGYRPGHARASWRVSLKTLPAGDNVGAVDPGGARTIAQGIRVIRGSRFGDNVLISSFAPYMERLDQGWSRQAGANFIENAARRGADSVPSDNRILPQSKNVTPRPNGGRR